MKKISLIPALLVFLVWLFLTFVLMFVLGKNESDVELSELVSTSFNYAIFLSALTVIAFSYLHKSNVRVGLSKSKKPITKLILLPAAIILVALLGAYIGNAFSDSTFVFWVLINTLFVGISEELMFRGVFLSSFTNKWGYWPAVILTSVMFGGIHVLNGFVTGDFSMSALQAVMATSSGLLFMAVRVCSLSILPAIILHWIWDFAAFVNGNRDMDIDNPIITIGSILVILGPVLFGIMGIIELRNKQIKQDFLASQLE